MAKQFYGIDLGTTFSCIARVDEYGKPEVLRNSEGQNTTPSVVDFESPDNVVVGAAAKEGAVVFPGRVIESVKRAMGDPDWKTEQHGRSYRAADVAAFVLRKLVGDASIGGEEIKDVVITCPAYFGLAERQATEQAGRIAGLNVHHILPEPTAAAIAHSIDQTQSQTIVVYDLGGGTFDVTVLRVEDESIDVVCVGGDDRLGGKNWDETIAEWLAHRFSEETGVPADDLTEELETWQELLQTAEAAKIRLSQRKQFNAKVVHGTDRVVVTLTREKFDELTRSLLERTLSLTEELLETAKAKDEKYGRIDKLLLVGGSTFMPQVEEAVKEWEERRKELTGSGFEVSFFDPNEAVAKGAALMAAKCQFDDKLHNWVEQRQDEVRSEIAREEGRTVAEVTDDEVRDRGVRELSRESGLALPGIPGDLLKKKIRNVTSKSFGVVVLDNGKERVQNLIAKNDTVPKSISQVFGTFAVDQTGVNIQCVENEMSEGPDDPTIDLDPSEIIGEAELAFAKPLPQGSPVEVRFSLREDSLLELFGTDLTTGREITAEFKSDAILTVEEVEEKRKHMMSIEVA